MRFIDAILALILGTALVATLHTQAAARVMAPAGQVDMSIGLDPPVSLVSAGQRTVFNFRIENHSRETARNVTATIQMPQGYRFEPMFYNSFWETCTTVNSGWPTMTAICTRKYFEPGRYAYISIAATHLTMMLVIIGSIS
jgi:hypothetical protein